MAHFRIKVMGIDIQRKANLFNIYDMLIFSRFFVTLGLLKAEFAVIDDLAHRRLSLRGNFHQIHIAFRRLCHGLRERHNTQLSAVLIYDTHFFIPNLFVDLQFLVANW